MLAHLSNREFGHGCRGADGRSGDRSKAGACRDRGDPQRPRKLPERLPRDRVHLFGNPGLHREHPHENKHRDDSERELVGVVEGAARQGIGDEAEVTQQQQAHRA